jgi:glutathione S-transferase
MLLALQAAGMDFRFEHVDISGDDALFARYGLLIPVLRAPDGRELHWPFEADALATFLRRQEPVRLGGS